MESDDTPTQARHIDGVGGTWVNKINTGHMDGRVTMIISV